MRNYHLVWSTRAAQDLRRIKSYIAHDKPLAAVQFIEKIKSKVERLQKFPWSGRTVLELGRDEIREILIGNYRVIYKIKLKIIFILTVFEGHQKFKNNLQNIR